MEKSFDSRQIDDLQRQLFQQQQLFQQYKAKTDQVLSKLKSESLDLQKAVISLAYGHFELQDLLNLSTRHPKLLNRFKKDAKFFTPLRQLHPQIYSRPGRPVSSEPNDIIHSCISAQEETIKEYIVSGYASQSGNIYQIYDEEKKNSISFKAMKVGIKLLLQLVGLMLTISLLLINFVKRPEVIVEVLMLKYSRKDLRKFCQKWFPMFFQADYKPEEVNFDQYREQVEENIKSQAGEQEGVTVVRAVFMLLFAVWLALYVSHRI